MSPADYTHSMYDTLSGAVIRPGMGTVGDCLASGVRIFAFHEPGNLEMVNNSRQLAAIGVGENCLDSADAWTRATAYLDDRESQARHAKASTHLEFGGAIAAASHLVNYMQNNTFIY